MSRSQTKTILVFFDIQRNVHNEFFEQGTTVNQFKYLEILKRLRETARQKRSHLWITEGWILFHDNSPVHAALSVREFFSEQIDCHSWSFSLLAWPRSFDSFQSWKLHWSEVRRHCCYSKSRKQHSEEYSKRGFQQWKHRMTKCVSENWKYFENC